jgi:hypothetical protein
MGAAGWGAGRDRPSPAIWSSGIAEGTPAACPSHATSVHSSHMLWRGCARDKAVRRDKLEGSGAKGMERSTADGSLTDFQKNEEK